MCDLHDRRFPSLLSTREQSQSLPHLICHRVRSLVNEWYRVPMPRNSPLPCCLIIALILWSEVVRQTKLISLRFGIWLSHHGIKLDARAVVIAL